MSKSYRPAMAAGRLAACVLLASAAASAAVRDRIPPVFRGLIAATTCIPGPVGGSERLSSFSLVWKAAKDNVTPPGRIAYEIYQSTSSGAEDFTRATYRTRRGVTSFVTPLLPSNGDTTYYFVVRARDAAGNRDRNRVERPGSNPCL